jgi:hypothetical protein
VGKNMTVIEFNGALSRMSMANSMGFGAVPFQAATAKVLASIFFRSIQNIKMSAAAGCMTMTKIPTISLTRNLVRNS